MPGQARAWTPRLKFRWRTERLKIKPSNRFIRDVVRASGEAILVLGTRNADGALRAANMTRRDARRLRERLSPNDKLPQARFHAGETPYQVACQGVRPPIRLPA
jgi:DNA sulfur modification protein DndC